MLVEPLRGSTLERVVDFFGETLTELIYSGGDVVGSDERQHELFQQLHVVLQRRPDPWVLHLDGEVLPAAGTRLVDLS